MFIVVHPHLIFYVRVLHSFIFFVYLQMSLNIIAPITTAIKEFHSPEEFNIYYQLHKEEIDGTTTHKLNKLYKIEGYRITKIKNVLMLKRNIEKNTDAEEINVKDEIATIKETLNKIINFLATGEQPGELEFVSPECAV